MKTFLRFACINAFVLLFLTPCHAQNQVAITIDDVPNTEKYEQDAFNPVLLNVLDSLQIPVAVFINKGKLEKTIHKMKNYELLEKWMNKDYATSGNHTYNHARYSDVGFKAFVNEVKKGGRLKKMNKKTNTPKYFRFPYNDLGKDSLQHVQIKEFLNQKGYYITPFTIESIDWMYNSVYEYYLKKNDTLNALKIGRDYIAKTIEYFDYFERLAQQKYNRPIKHIYLCHDNSINANYLPLLITCLKEKKYSFISLNEALQDEVYKQESVYYKKWGVSWLYRWMPNQKERTTYIKNEPSTQEIESLYANLIENKSK
ncbi:polysaccharide deacetylase family protein [Flavobacterium sp.]|uniref:polysaccharide deacetylase family protein n=1 Tax=Flavobacterium sp. TaxID=239 RepID=UPI003D14E57C